MPHFGFDTTLPVYLGVLPRREGATAEDIRWFKRGNCFASHVMNAFQEGTKIHFDTPEAKNNMFPFFPDMHGAPFNGPESASFLTRWTVDMASNSDEFESCTRLTDMMGEFPRIDDRYRRREISLRLDAGHRSDQAGRTEGRQRRRADHEHARPGRS